MNRIASCFRFYRYNDNNITKGLLSKIENYYKDNGEAQKKHTESKIGTSRSESNRKRKGIKVKANFKNTFNTSVPFIDSKLWSHVRSNSPHLAPRTVNIPTGCQIKKADEESIESYTRVSSTFGRLDSVWITSAATSAASTLGLCNPTSKGGRLRPLGVQQAIEKSIKKSNAGFPTFKKKTHPDAINDCKIWMNRILNRPNYFTFFSNTLFENYLVVLRRFQIFEIPGMMCDIKIRQVWCTPMRIICLENFFFRGLLDRVSEFNKYNRSPNYTSGFRNVEISELLLKRLRNKIGTERGKALFSMDYSKYDRSIPDFAIDLFFAVCRDELEMSDTESKLYNMLRYYTKYSPIIYDNELYFKKRGISSGSLLTNLFDSWWNLTLWNMSQSIVDSGNYDEFYNDPNSLIRGSLNNRLSCNKSTDDIVVCGDDVIIYTTPKVVLTCIELCKLFDMTLEVKMSTTNPRENIFFLGRYWDEYNSPFQSDFYLVLHSIFRTRFYDKSDLPYIDISDELSVNRLISIFCQFKNGYKTLIKIFGTYPPLIRFFEKRRGFYRLGDWRSDTVQYKPFEAIYSWKNF